MSVAKRVYKLILRTKEITEKKMFKVSLMGFLTFLLFFGTFSAYAQEDGLISPAWEGTKEFHNTISGTDADEDNMNSREGLEVLNSGWTAVSLLAPEMTANGEEVIQNMNIPYDLRRGLLGMTEDAATTVYAIYPLVDIPNHLAQQWVPGYKESVTGLYAANSSSNHPSGYAELKDSGIVSLWSRVLNLSYVIFIVIMILAGFMIMFRHKLGGQAMVTLGSVLPKVIFSLILATFSFAIAGFIIDIGGLIAGLISYIFGLGGDMSSVSTLGNIMGSVFTGGVKTTSIVSGVVGGLGIGTFLTAGALGAAPVAAGATAATGFAGIAALVSNPVGWAVAGVIGAIGLLIALVILGIILTGAIKVLITLYKAYFSLLLAVILGPLQITLGAIPGNSHTIKNWFLSILRNVLVFPVVLFIVNLPNALAASGDDILLRFPGKLVFEDPVGYAGSNGLNIAAGVFLFILKIFVLFYAAQAPKFLESWFPPSSPKAMGEGFGNAKASLSKVPLVGGLFK